MFEGWHHSVNGQNDWKCQEIKKTLYQSSRFDKLVSTLRGRPDVDESSHHVLVRPLGNSNYVHLQQTDSFILRSVFSLLIAHDRISIESILHFQLKIGVIIIIIIICLVCHSRVISYYSTATNEYMKMCNPTDNNSGQPEPQFVDLCSLSVEQIRKMANGTDKDRKEMCVPLSSVKKEDILKVQPMSFGAELMCLIFLSFVVPLGVFTLPPTVALFGKFVVGDVKTTFKVFGLLLLPLFILPQPYKPSTLQSYLSIQITKYFSYRFIYEEHPPDPSEKNYNPMVMVAPPHGVFPYGNILAILTFPSLFGYPFKGLASSAALRPPIFKQVLRSIGVIDASRHVARKALENGESIGISTGGVAEIFLTNDENECILLKERIGLIKLSIRTGSDIVPCYLFGNTKLLNCWAGEGIPGLPWLLEKLSRKLGFALILIYGRFFLPVPFRKPILAVTGRPIKTAHLKCEDPTPEQVQAIQKILLGEMERVFETYKPYYDWDDKHLIIK